MDDDKNVKESMKYVVISHHCTTWNIPLHHHFSHFRRFVSVMCTALYDEREKMQKSGNVYEFILFHSFNFFGYYHKLREVGQVGEVGELVNCELVCIINY